MTENYKKMLFSYLKGNLPLESGTDDEIFKEIDEISRQYWTEFLPADWTDFHFEGALQDKTSNNVVIYGGYYDTEKDDANGIIIILNDDFVPIKSFLTFSDGTKLRYIDCMNQDDDGTYIIVDDTCFSWGAERNFIDNIRRFLMLNNFSTPTNGQYVLEARKIYLFPSDMNNFKCEKIEKNPSSSEYIMSGKAFVNNNNTFHSLKVVSLTINVGSNNEWNSLDVIGTFKSYYEYGDSIINFNSEGNYSVKILAYHYIENNPNIRIFEKEFNEPELTYHQIYNINDQTSLKSDYVTNQAVFKNENLVYFVLTNQYIASYENVLIKLIEYNLESSESKEIFKKEYGSGSYLRNSSILLNVVENNLYINYTTKSGNSTGNYYIQRYEGSWNPILVAENKPWITDNRMLFTIYKYNLLKIFLIPSNPNSTSWFFAIIKENYNSSNYNGEPYINTNALTSHSGELYSNDNLVFARNLYNKTISENSTVSTIEVPNNYLNGIDITQKNLLSETNLNLIQDNNTIQKNVYETLFINFINTLIISDQNNNFRLINSSASTYLNSSINDSTKYDSAKLYNKGILTYQDGSTKEINYEFQDINDTSTHILFGVYVDKLINKLEIVSNDKTMVYQTIDLTELEINKTYNIKQKLEVV